MGHVPRWDAALLEDVSTVVVEGLGVRRAGLGTSWLCLDDWVTVWTLALRSYWDGCKRLENKFKNNNKRLKKYNEKKKWLNIEKRNKIMDSYSENHKNIFDKNELFMPSLNLNFTMFIVY